MSAGSRSGRTTTTGIRHQGHERQRRKGRVPRRHIHRVRPGQPPEVVTLGIDEASERELRALANRGVNAQPRHQRFEGTERLRRVRYSQTVIQGVAPKRALRVIDALEYLVEHEVVPGAVIERHRLVAQRRPRAMRLRDLLHPVRARQPGAPVRAQLQQTLLPRLSQHEDDGDEASRGKGQPDGRNHVAVTLARPHSVKTVSLRS